MCLCKTSFKYCLYQWIQGSPCSCRSTNNNLNFYHDYVQQETLISNKNWIPGLRYAQPGMTIAWSSRTVIRVKRSRDCFVARALLEAPRNDRFFDLSPMPSCSHAPMRFFAHAPTHPLAHAPLQCHRVTASCGSIYTFGKYILNTVPCPTTL